VFHISHRDSGKGRVWEGGLAPQFYIIVYITSSAGDFTLAYFLMRNNFSLVLF
jgi:hypothetical protein